MRMKLLVPFVAAILVGRVAAEPGPATRVMPWDVEALSKVPVVHATTERAVNGMKSFFFEGAEYKGKPTWVFAYYAAPAGQPPEGGWPAVVCAHGGGGTAFPAWVAQWNRNGYAGICRVAPISVCPPASPPIRGMRTPGRSASVGSATSTCPTRNNGSITRSPT